MLLLLSVCSSELNRLFFILFFAHVDSDALCNMVNQMQLFGVERLTIGLPAMDLCQIEHSSKSVIMQDF